MTFSKKIFLYSVLLFLVLFSGGGIVLVEKINAENLQTAIESSMYKYSNTKSIMDLHSDMLLISDINDDINLKNWMEVTMNGYVMNYVDSYYIELYSNDNKEIMSNLNVEINEERKELINAAKDKKSFLIRDINGENYVFVSSKISLKNRDLKLIIGNNIQYVYDQRINNYKLLLIIDILVFIILAIGMSIISKNLTIPLVKLSNASKDIAEGDYSKRVELSKSTTEIELLENNFNIMINVIEGKIDELKLLNESKQRFIDSLNHEIKTPLTAIIGYSDLLLKSKLNEEMKIKALTHINNEGKRLETLNSTLLNLILIREKKIEKMEHNLSELLLSVTNVMGYKLEQEKITIVTNVENVLVKVDKQLFIVLISNLIDNGIKASRENSKIYLVGKRKKDGYIIKIIDEGMGIPKEDLDKIVEPFYMVDKARTRKTNSIGLGMAICKEICDIHAISLHIESQLGLGTEIILTLNKECFVDER